MSIRSDRVTNSLILLLAVLMTCAQVSAQFTTGTVTGRVVDPSANVIAGAPVTLMSESTKGVRKTTTNEIGAFTFAAVPPGAYSITVEQQGFQRFQRTGFIVSTNERASLGDIMLTLGTLAEQITVTTEGALVQTSSSENSALITSKQLEMLSIRSRDAISLLRLAPGVVNTEDWDLISPRGFGTNTPNIQGNRNTWNIVSVDGLSGQDLGSPAAFNNTVNMDAIAEMTVLSNNYQAEHGHSNGGAAINILTRSGSQEFHGTGYGYLRNEVLNANNFFGNKNAVARPLYRYLSLGASLGGPIYIPKTFNTKKDKLFFFYSFEDWVTRTPKPIQLITVPTLLERAGNFSQSLDVSGRLIVVKDPLTQKPLPENIIPATRINPMGQAILGIFHPPNALDRSVTLGNYNYTMQESMDSPKRQNLFKIDYSATQNDRISVRGSTLFSNQKGYNINNPSSTWDLVKTQYIWTNNVIGLDYRRIFSPSLVNEFYCGYSHGVEKGPVLNDAELAHVVRSAVGLGALGQWYPQYNPLNLIPRATFGGITGAASINIHERFDQAGVDTNFNASDNLTLIHNRHQLKFGFFGEVLRNDEPAAGIFMGAFSFGRDVKNPFDSNHPYANAVLGNFQSYTESTTRPPFQGAKRVVEWFAQDNWKVRPNLTLEYGMRFIRYTPWLQRGQKGSAFSPERYDPSQVPLLYAPALDANGARVGKNPLTGATVPAALIGYFVPGTGNSANGLVVASDKTYPLGWIEQPPIQVSPRLGFAYDPTGRGKTAIRGGAGIFPMGRLGAWYSLIQQPPTQYNPVVFYGSLNTFIAAAGLLSPSSAMGMDRNSGTPTLYKYTFGIQQEIGFGTVAEVNYLGNLGRHLIVSQDLNTVPYGAQFLPQNADPTTNTPLPDNFFRPYPGLSSITYRSNTGTSNYNALEVAVNRRFADGVQLGVAYTWSKSMDTTSSDGGNVTLYLPTRIWNYGKSTFDQTHNFVFNYTWDLPKASKLWSNAVVKRVFDNWQLSGLTVFASGLPSGVGFTTTDSANITGGGDFSRIVVTGKAQLPHGDRTLERWFNTSVVARPAKNDYGNAPKDIFRLPGMNNWDITMFKRFPIRSEERSLELRWEMYNAFNHTQLSGVNSTARFDPSGNQVNAQFGQATGARSPRIMQGELRFRF
jgi:hypothetical protein